MDMKHVVGRDKGKIVLYALSTCVWCKKTKRFLSDHGVAYDYIDVDLLGEKEKEKAKHEITRWNPRCSFPTLVINDNSCIVGYDEEKMRKVVADE